MAIPASGVGGGVGRPRPRSARSPGSVKKKPGGFTLVFGGIWPQARLNREAMAPEPPVSEDFCLQSFSLPDVTRLELPQSFHPVSSPAVCGNVNGNG